MLSRCCMLCWKLIAIQFLNSPSILAVHLSSWHPCQGADNVMAGAGISAKTTSPLPVTDTCLPVCRALARRTHTHRESRFPSICLMFILNNLQNVLQDLFFESCVYFLFFPLGKLKFGVSRGRGEKKEREMESVWVSHLSYNPKKCHTLPVDNLFSAAP